MTGFGAGPAVGRARSVGKREVQKWDRNERGNSTSATCGSVAETRSCESSARDKSPSRRGGGAGVLRTLLEEGSVQTRLEKSGWGANVNRNLRLRLAREILINKFIWTLCVERERHQSSCCVQEVLCS